MPGLKQHLKRVEAKHRELAELREGKRAFLFVTFMPRHVEEFELPEPGPGERSVEDFYIDRPVHWHPNYTMLNGTGVRRNTSDPDDHGLVYDERTVEHDWSEGPPRDLPVLSKLRPGGKIDPREVKHWPAVIVSKRRIATGTVKKRAGAR